MIKRFLRAAEAAQYLGLAPQTLAKWRCGASGDPQIPFFHIGSRVVLYDVADLDAFVLDRRQLSTRTPPTEEKR